ncbi:MAG: pyridoxamine 5'-phosphate oxidase [Acidimicrobiales bacterium]|jgi:pyridoxamine 5'-phosphate oxidase|nr:pyridoxamine 5'-phosphate oxidase [Acidimicrobiales bacterium]
MDLTATRAAFEEQGLRRADVDGDPLVQFERWFAQAQQVGVHQPEAVALATADVRGRPSVRHVLLKGVEDGAFLFFTNYGSRKATELDANPWAAMVFPWHEVSRQVRVCGSAHRLEPAASDAYFATRPRGSQLGAWASTQSHPLVARAELEARVAAQTERWEGRAVQRPEHWGGFALVPVELEFWQGRPDRLHDRFRYTRVDGGWDLERLSP